MERELQRIANTLVLYSYHVESNGFLNGKIGIILFLYRYARYSNCEYYSNFADDLLDGVLSSVARTPPDFENGLAGIGNVVNYLLKNEYVEGDSNEVLLDVDKRVFSNLRCDPSASVLGQGLYWRSRMEDNKGDALFGEYTERCLQFCNGGIKNYKGQISLYHINSVLFFLLETCKLKKYKSKTSSIKELLPNILEEIFSDKVYDGVDFYIFNRLLDEIPINQKQYWQNIISFKNLQSKTKKNDIESAIKKSWLEELYFKKSDPHGISLEKIINFVDKKQESLMLDDFLYNKGLTGLGNMLLSNQS